MSKETAIEENINDVPIVYDEDLPTRSTSSDKLGEKVTEFSANNEVDQQSSISGDVAKETIIQTRGVSRIEVVRQKMNLKIF